jgi:hypothetical protein
MMLSNGCDGSSGNGVAGGVTSDGWIALTFRPALVRGAESAIPAAGLAASRLRGRFMNAQRTAAWE